MRRLRTRRRWLVPEVIQTSAMDCGPAVLTCLLKGFGIPVHYGRLREACQTDVDGTSIDVLEEIVGEMGLAGEQVMIPPDHLFLPEADALPAIVVVRLPSGLTHFVLVWRRHGPLIQVMDPASGRRWLTERQLLDEIYVHRQPVSATAWREWAASPDMLLPLARRLRNLGLRDGSTWLAAAVKDSGWESLSRLDAAVRFAAALVGSKSVRRGREAGGVLRSLLGHPAADASDPALSIPDPFWSVRPGASAADGTEQLLLQGAVLIRVRGRKPSVSDVKDAALAEQPLNPELRAALAQPASRPLRTLLGFLRGGRSFFLPLLGFVLVVLAASTVLEGVLFRAILDLGRQLSLVEQRVQAVGVLLALSGVVLLLEWRVTGHFRRLGRAMEVRLRQAFLEKIPRLNDRYFQSRPISDMAERCHILQQIRLLPRMGGQLLLTTLTLLLTAAGIAWLAPDSAALALAMAAGSACVPLLFLPLLQRLDLRVRTHTGALGSFYLDTLIGLSALYAHGAETPVRREHEALLVEWVRASRQLIGSAVVVEGVQLVVGYSLAGWLLVAHGSRASDVGGLLLLAYWTLNLPVLGEEVALLVRQYPMYRNMVLRLLEPLGAPDEPDLPAAHVPADPPGADASRRGAVVRFEAVTVRAAGHTILHDICLNIEAGSHVAIVGASGAGKSSLIGLLLGWHRPAAGAVVVDGARLDAARLDILRAQSAWVDPAIQLWNRSLLENLLYGSRGDTPELLGPVLEAADLHDVLERLPEGMQSMVGEGGGCLSGGEGQRVRLGRALHRSHARLVLLDEPFRGLDRAKRRLLLRRAQEFWRDATLLCVTHDVSETIDFDRVLVLGDGRVLEDDSPQRLAGDATSEYRKLLDAEEAVRMGLWSIGGWRRLRLAGGQLQESTTEGPS
jgi:ABC-type bacteriocin/lantibiotic exporter with double-glycine peptidase domain